VLHSATSADFLGQYVGLSMEIRKTARLKETKVYSEIVAMYDTNVDT